MELNKNLTFDFENSKYFAEIYGKVTFTSILRYFEQTIAAKNLLN